MRDPGTRHDFAAGDRAREQSQAIHWLAVDPAHEARRVAVAPETAVPGRRLPGFRKAGRRRNFKIQGARGPRFGDECLPMDDANPFRRSVYIHGNIEGRRHPEPNACRPIDERRHGTARVPSIAGVLRTVEAVLDRDGGRRHRTVTVPEPGARSISLQSNQSPIRERCIEPIGIEADPPFSRVVCYSAGSIRQCCVLRRVLRRFPGAGSSAGSSTYRQVRLRCPPGARLALTASPTLRDENPGERRANGIEPGY